MQSISPSTASDFQTVQYFLNTRDSDSFGLLYRRYAPRVYQKCLLMLGEEALAKDATQEVFIRAFLRLSDFRQEAKFSTWLFTITNNYCIDRLRRRKRQKVSHYAKMEFAREIPEEKPAYRQREEKLATLERVIDALQPKDRRILYMKFRDEMPIKAIAQAMGKTESAVKMRLQRAKAKAREAHAQLQ